MVIAVLMSCAAVAINLVIHILGFCLRPKSISSTVLLVLGVGAVIVMGGLYYWQIPARDPNGLYQSGTLVASVHDPNIDKKTQTIIFGAATTTTGMLLDMNSMFEFRYWKLQCSGKPQERTATRLPLPLPYSNLVCHIQGYR
jgi:hypothetical protein